MNQQGLFEDLAVETKEQRRERTEGEKARNEAFRRIVGELSEREQLWWARIASYGPRGCTADELSAVHGQPQNEFSGRITKLVKKGLVKRTEKRRETRAGSQASVLVARTYLSECEQPELKE